MYEKFWIRVAAVVTVLLAVGHSLGHPWAPASNDQSRAVFQAMGANHFDVLGFSRSYEDFYLGFGWMLAAYLFGHAVLFWQLAGLSVEAPRSTRAIVGVLLFESLVVAALAGKYLFWVPLLTSGAIALCLGMALLARRSQAPQGGADEP